LHKFEEYELRAADCLRVAQDMQDPVNKGLMLEMAKAWLNLADRVRGSIGPHQEAPSLTDQRRKRDPEQGS
jgi:hypothetical protein